MDWKVSYSWGDCALVALVSAAVLLAVLPYLR